MVSFKHFRLLALSLVVSQLFLLVLSLSILWFQAHSLNNFSSQ